MEIPKDYHAQVVARSSTRKNFGVMLTNAIGIIDESYCGDNDIWFAEFYAVSSGHMRMGDRILQFRLVKNGDPIEFEYVDHLGNEDRGGHGSTGI
jgi:dUTP pyrophosphatase